MPPVRSSSGSGEQQQSQKVYSRAGRSLPKSATLFDAVYAFAASQEASVASKSGNGSAAAQKATAASAHKNPFIGVQKLVMPEGQKVQAPLSAKGRQQEGNQMWGAKSLGADKPASRELPDQNRSSSQPVNPFTTANGGSFRNNKAGSSKARWQVKRPSANRIEKTSPAAQQSSDQQQQNVFQNPAQPSWTTFKTQGGQTADAAPVSGLREASAGSLCY